MSDTSRAALIPIAIVAVAVVGLTFLVLIVGRDPAIRAVEPTVVDSGDEIVISGRHFGTSLGHLAIGKTTLPGSSIVSWTDESVHFVMPRNVDSGLLYVTSDRGTSAGVLIQLRASAPRVVADGTTPGAPQIADVDASVVQVGTLLTLSGTHFGNVRRGSSVAFPMTGAGPCDACTADYGYASWSDTRIVTRVPSGATTGFIVVRTAWGESNPVRISVEHPAGEIVWSDPSELALRYGARVDAVDLAQTAATAQPGQHDIALQLPDVRESPAQRSLRYLDDLPNAFRFRNVNDRFSREISRTFVIERYSATSSVEPSRIGAAYEDETGFHAYFTRSVSGVPADDEAVVAVANRLRNGRRSPYRIAEAVYDYVVDSLTFALGLADRSVTAGLESGYGDDLTYSALFVALLRAADVPARSVGGVLVTSDGESYAHFWAEFFVTGVGWIPVDPALGDGALPAAFPVADDVRAYYFGNLDSRRVAFSHGLDDRVPSFLDGVAVVPDDPYSFQQVYAEGGALVASFGLAWTRPRVVGDFRGDGVGAGNERPAD